MCVRAACVGPGACLHEVGLCLRLWGGGRRAALGEGLLGGGGVCRCTGGWEGAPRLRTWPGLGSFDDCLARRWLTPE